VGGWDQGIPREIAQLRPPQLAAGADLYTLHAQGLAGAA
jgi:hypothetical protein